MATLDGVTVSAHGVTWGQFSGQHLWAAAHFAREANRHEEAAMMLPRPEDNHDLVRWHVVTAIMTSAAAVEAYAGEIGAEPEKLFPNRPPSEARFEIEKMLKGSSILPKYRKLAELADGSTSLDWMKGEERALNDLILLRNKLIHFSGEPPWARKVHDEVEQRLAQHFAGTPLLPGARFFPEGFNSYACAKWCVETARAFVVAFAARYSWPVDFSTKPVHAAKLALP
ncbi:MAG: hypothetical protein U0183_25315 [Polyangiaceae bacterium]